MIIGYDGKRAVNNLTGLGNYSRLVIGNIAHNYPEHNIIAYTPNYFYSPRLSSLKNFLNLRWQTPASMQRFPSSVWRTFGMGHDAKKDGVEIFHGLSNELPLNIKSTGIKSVVTIHDLIYRRLPECYNLVDRKLYDWKYGSSCRNADRIIAISEATKSDIVKYYGIEDNRIDVIYQGCADIFRERLTFEQILKVKYRYRIPSQYLVQVGTVEKRKNLELSIRALAALPPHYHYVELVVVGKGGKYKKEMHQLAKSLNVGKKIIWLENVEFADLPAIYQGSLAILYPSRYEGFGIPVLEGLESRRPVIAASTSSLPEAGGEATIYVDPDDVRAMKDAIESILCGRADVRYMTGAGLRHASKFNTSAMAENIMHTYLRTLGKI